MRQRMRLTATVEAEPNGLVSCASSATPGDPVHASVITGYNTRRKEFLVTECWGENYRNQRISYEELLATTKPKIIQVVSP